MSYCDFRVKKVFLKLDIGVCYVMNDFYLS